MEGKKRQVAGSIGIMKKNYERRRSQRFQEERVQRLGKQIPDEGGKGEVRRICGILHEWDAGRGIREN